MVGLKRRASETLLPIRAPKQARTTLNHPLGGSSSPSQNEALLSRWTRLGMEFFSVVRDTWSALFDSFGGAKPRSRSMPTYSPPPSREDEHGQTIPSPPPSASASASPPPAPGPPPTSAPRKLPARQPIPMFPPREREGGSQQRNHISTSAPSNTSIHQRVQTGPDGGRVGAQRPYPQTFANAVASTSKNTLSGAQDPNPNANPNSNAKAKVSEYRGDPKSTGLMSPPSSQDSASSLRSAVTQAYPEVAVALKQNPRRRRKSVKQYVEREHIHAKAHKARVKEEQRRAREQMEKDLKELYSIRRSAGFFSDYDSFTSLLDYQARLEKLDKTGALSPSPSLGDLRARARQDENRRHSFPDHVDPDFLQRAIQKAQNALKGPKPPKPFVPTLDQLRLSRLAKDHEIEERLRPKRKPLPASLPPKEDAEVDALFRKRGVIAQCVKEQVSDMDISRLQPAQWLNDEIINFYGQMIQSRSEDSKENPGVNGKASGKKPLNVHYFSTFFWSKLKGQGYEKGRLAKWTKKIDIFSKDAILIPVNHNNAHWTAAAINFRKKRIESFDSMNMDRSSVFKLLRHYLDEEHRNKKKKPFDFTGWEDYTSPDTPQQENGFDCGVFTCQFLEALSRGEEDFAFTQANMPYLRRKMVWEIAHVQIKSDP